VNDPKPTVERIYEILGAHQQGDEEKVRAMMHPDSEVHAAPGLINAGTYYGYDGFQKWMRQWEEAWDNESYELGEMIEVSDDIVVVPTHIVAVGAVSGLRIDAVFGWLYEWRDGLAYRFHVYPDVESALEAARRFAADRV
jgi:ketosteroid isomerase-like protein